MPAKTYVVTLTPEERYHLTDLVPAGKRSARTITRAWILLLAEAAGSGPGREDARIAAALGCGRRTVEHVRQRFVEHGPDAALYHRPQCRPSVLPKVDGGRRGPADCHRPLGPAGGAGRLVAAAAGRPPGGAGGGRVRIPGDGPAGAKKTGSIRG
jgi:hypothetical protein